MNGKAFRLMGVVLLLFLMSVMVAAAQDTPVEPGPPPPMDPGTAHPDPRYPPVEDPTTGQQFPVVCDSNWCYIAIPEGMSPDQFEAWYHLGEQFPAGCWNSGGNICIVAPNSPEADEWLRDWAHWMYYQYGNNLCVLLATECAIPGWEPWIPPVSPPDQGNGNNGGNEGTSTPTPQPTPTPRPTPTRRPTAPPPTRVPTRPTPPPPSDAGCPAANWWRTQPTFDVESAPAFPLVAGQDPDDVGVIYTATLTIPPVVYQRWWAEYQCVPVPDEDQDGAPDRKGNCTTQIGDPPVDWPGDWTLKACHPQRFLLPDPVVGYGSFEMVLRESSRRWIREELAQKYPGARVRMPEIRMTVRGRGWLRADRAYVYQAVVNPKPVDPGVYDVTLLFRTQGTGVTRPLVLRKEIEQTVYLLETTIVK